MSGRVLQVSVGMPAPVCFRDRQVTTAIYKRPVDGEVAVDELHLAGDGQADLSVHGGRDKAVYAYPACHYETWEQELGVKALEAAQFGENLTVAGVSEETVLIGSRYRIGSAELIVTQPRLPCFKLGIRMQDETFPARFLQSGRLGFYLRVEQTGILTTGDVLQLLEAPEHGISVHDLWRAVFAPEKDVEMARVALDVLPHLDEGWLRRLRRIAASG